MICPVCSVVFVSTTWNKRFCSYGCYDKCYSLKHMKETFRLSPSDLELRDRLRS